MLIKTGSALLLVYLALPAIALAPQEDSPWVVNGTVNNVLRTNSDGLLYAGWFSRAGPLTGPLVKVTEGEIKEIFPNIIGHVHIVKADGNGGFYVGGEFVIDAETEAQNLVRIEPDGTVDWEWLPNPDGAVNTIEINDAGIFIGGQFDKLFGQERGAVAKLSLAGELEPWRIDLNYVNKIVSDSQRVYISGGFQLFNSHVNKQPVHNSHGLVGIDKYDSGSVSWRSGFVGGANITDIEIKDGLLYLCGKFKHLNLEKQQSVARQGFAVQDIESGKLLGADLKLNDNAKVYSVELYRNKIYLSGNFKSVNNLDRDKLVELDLTGKVTAWIPPVLDSDRTPINLKVIDDELYILGQFNTYSSYLGGLSAWSTLDGMLEPSPLVNGAVKGLAFDEKGHMIVAGNFTKIGETDRRHFAQVDKRGAVTGHDPQLDGPVSHLWRVHHRTWLAGEFNGANRYWCPGLLALNGDGEVTFCPSVKGVVSSVLAFDDHTVITGNFTEFEGEAVNGLVVLDKNLTLSELTPEFKSDAKRYVRSAVVHDDKLYFSTGHTLMAMNRSGEIQKVPAPSVDVRQLKSHGEILALIGTKEIIELDTHNKVLKRQPIDNHSIYISPSIVTEYVDGNYILGSTRQIGKNGKYGAIVPGDEAHHSIALNSAVYTLTLHSNILWVGSDPGTSNATPALSALKVDLRTKSVSGDLGIAPTAEVATVTKVGESTVFAGNSTSFNSKAISTLIKTDTNGVADRGWHLEEEYKNIRSADIIGENIYLCATRGKRGVIASVNIQSGTTNWHKEVSMDGNRCQLKAHNDNIYVAHIHKIGKTKTYLALLDTKGNVIDTDMVDGMIKSMNKSNGKLFIMGGFSQVQGVTREGIASIDEQGEVTDWGTPVAQEKRLSITNILNFNDMYIVLGSFHIDGIRHVLALNESGNRTHWKLNKNFSSSIVAAAQSNAHVFVSGYFDHLSEYDDHKINSPDQVPLYGIAVFDAEGTIVQWNPGVYKKPPRDLLIWEDNLYIGWPSMGRYSEKPYRAKRMPRNVGTLGPIKIPSQIQ